ncbi:hypothetical protein JN01_0344 [Entomoplasma freundtii]|uniref:UPF0122 protein EFREU_v1c02170 n=1 Tax=Entomoplasma freundtii TaxID=74700 RepID=A0A2K8NR32_9MOLU|nr:DNA-binding protein [Entomoplasma freundtii]ATZ16244.1 DNA-binding protein [Entomoplasma freundtii]TDY56855.1 hypothetical protein JN01_0344 [Entomoplasma freundtii]
MPKVRAQNNFALAELLAIYESLLSKKQVLYLNLYLNEDLSLQEIADNYQVSKNAVYDSIQKATANLHKWETNLHLKTYQDQQSQQEAIYQKFKESTNPEIQAILKLLKNKVA